MKFFSVNPLAKGNISILYSIALCLMLHSCATYAPQYGKEASPYDAVKTYDEEKKPLHRFYLVGDAGYASQPHTQEVLSIISERLKGEGKNTTLFYLGDNIYPHGMPVKKDAKGRKEAEASLEAQIALAKIFKGNTLFIPGNHDWYNGYEGLREQEKFVKDRLGKDVFLPGKGCGITDIEINDNLTLIAIDSEWYIEDWDDYPTINDDCSIKTREDLFTELEDLLNKNQNKVIVLAIHHPVMSNGAHGGQFSARKQLFPINPKIPLPVLGSVINVARVSSGYSTQDIQSRIYITLSKRVKALVQGRENVIIVSGHDHNLQYINNEGIHQIISGAGSKEEAAKAVFQNDFSYGGAGYAILDINTNGTGDVSYFSTKNGKEEKLFERKMLIKPEPVIKKYPTTFPPTVTTSVYTPEMVDKSGFHKFLFGNHYREYYATPIKAKTVLLDTLYGGLKPIKTGGGHQTNSLRLADKDGKEYAMRAVKKSATRFLQAVAFKNQYIGDALDNTFADHFLMDFYTTAHPYLPATTAKLAGSAGIPHTHPQLLYVPKQNALGAFNDDFGDALYVIEEHVHKEQKDLPSFGKADDIDDTPKLLKNLRKDPKYSIDEKAYIRARLFDILIGDWDRHGDQWKWAVHKQGDSIVYKPIPKDHDQAFPKYDGALMSILMNIPALRQMKTYKNDIRNVKWLNKVAYPLDLALITKAAEQDWIDEAEHLQKSITPEAIDRAFAGLPAEVKNETIAGIRSMLLSRKDKLKDIALRYRDVLLETVLVTGTDKKERFVITRLPEGETKIEVFSVKDGKEKLIHSQSYNRNKTKEIWVYGLDDDDLFEVKGKAGRKPIRLKLLGGQNHDSYSIEDGKKVKLYDFKSKENTYTGKGSASLILTDDYETNAYDYKKPAYDVPAGYPSIGFNPDDGVKLGGVFNYTINNFNRRPYSQKHSVKAHYYFATSGFEFGYRGNFMNVAQRWNFAIDATYTSPNFSISYFGLGNETPNFDDDLGRNYNRVKLQVFKVAPAFFSESRNGSFTQIQASFETVEIGGPDNRFVNQPGIAEQYLFEHRQFAGANATYRFENYDNKSLPALGMNFFLNAGWKTSLDELESNFPHTEAGVTIIYKITPDDKLVASTTVNGKVLFNDNFEFYQGATLGGDIGLRAYRRERFTGRSAFFHSTDVRYSIGTFKNAFVPVTYGVFGGYDYGRVWIKNDKSEKWHQSVGGGIFINAVSALTARAFYFVGSDGGRFAAGLSFGF